MMNNIVSIVIVNFNNESMLRNCLKSLYMYSDNINFEVIISDNSTYNLPIDDLEKKYSNLKVLKHNKNIGFAQATNKGLELANGKYFLSLNNDTLFTENTLNLILDYYSQFNDPDQIMLGCKLLNQDLSHQLSVVDFDSLWNLFGENFFLYKIFLKSKRLNRYHHFYKNIDKPTDVDILKGAFIFMTRKRFLELGGFDERFYFYGEEHDLCYQHKKLNGRVIYFPNSSIIHLGGGTTQNIPWFSYKNLSISKIKLFQKHFTGPTFIIALFIHYCGMLIRVPIYFLHGVLTFKKSMFLKSYYFFKLLFIYPKNVFK